MKLSRWIVDTDGRGACRVVEDTGGHLAFLNADTTREACEALIRQRVKRDAERLHRARQRSGERLAARRNA